MTLRYGESFSLCKKRMPDARGRMSKRLSKHLGFLFIFVVCFFFANLYAAQEYLNVPPPAALAKLQKASVAPPDLKISHPHLAPLPPKSPTVCLIMDDVGRDRDLLHRLADIPFPITVSVLPDLTFTRESAEWAHGHGFEVMLHMPMQPEQITGEDAGSDALYVSMNRRQLEWATQKALSEVPYAVGVNNHMGSRFTQDRAKLRIVMRVLAEEHLYFVDSRTTAESVAYQLAQEKGIPSSERSLFLDDAHDVVPISQRFRELIQTARENGEAVGICHFRPETIAVLTSLPPDTYRDIHFVFASQIVR